MIRQICSEFWVLRCWKKWIMFNLKKNKNKNMKFKTQKNKQQWISFLWEISWFIVFFNFFMRKSLWFSKIIIIKFEYSEHHWFQLMWIFIQNFVHWAWFNWESVEEILIIQIIVSNILSAWKIRFELQISFERFYWY